MSVAQRWKKPVGILAAAGLVVLMSQSVVPTGASAVDPGTVRAVSGKPKPKLLKPDLVVLRARDLYIQRTSAGRFLRFESALGNIGRGPVEVRPNTNQPCPTGHHHATQIIYRDVDGSHFYRRSVDTQVARRSAGCMIFHPQHNHWHFQAASKYTLFRPGTREDVVLVARRKMSFCLRDSRGTPAHFGTFHQPQHYGACSKYSPQGISTGWVDVYQSFLAGQALRLPKRARNGFYCLRIKVDPKNQLLESNDDDNTSLRAFTLRGDRITFKKVRRCR